MIDSNIAAILYAISAISWYGDELAYQIEQGNAVEVREPREFTTTGYRDANMAIHAVNKLPDWVCGKFEVTIREVLE